MTHIGAKMEDGGQFANRLFNAVEGQWSIRHRPCEHGGEADGCWESNRRRLSRTAVLTMTGIYADAVRKSGCGGGSPLSHGLSRDSSPGGRAKGWAV